MGFYSLGFRARGCKFTVWGSRRRASGLSSFGGVYIELGRLTALGPGLEVESLHLALMLRVRIYFGFRGLGFRA